MIFLPSSICRSTIILFFLYIFRISALSSNVLLSLTQRTTLYFYQIFNSLINFLSFVKIKSLIKNIYIYIYIYYLYFFIDFFYFVRFLPLGWCACFLQKQKKTKPATCFAGSILKNHRYPKYTNTKILNFSKLLENVYTLKIASFKVWVRSFIVLML